MNEETNVLTIKTVQIQPFRTLMTALKDILQETNISFQPDGLRIINMDKTHTILVHLFLYSNKFELYDFNLFLIFLVLPILYKVNSVFNA